MMLTAQIALLGDVSMLLGQISSVQHGKLWLEHCSLPSVLSCELEGSAVLVAEPPLRPDHKG